jgi:hypothetical protein
MGMGKTRVRVNESQRDGWIKNFEKIEERGEYEAFLRTQDVTSSGIKTRFPCPINPGRVYHTLSNNETFTLVQLLHDPTVVDIKEQYPETNIKKSKAFAKALKIKHPRYTWSATDTVVTWDFLCTLLSGKKRAISVKPSYLIGDKRTEEKFDLERALAKSLGYEYLIVTDKEVKTEEVQNILRVLRGAVLETYLESLYPRWREEFFDYISESPHAPISAAVEQLSATLNINFIESFTLMQHAFWVHDISSDPKVPLYPEYSPYVLGVQAHA